VACRVEKGFDLVGDEFNANDAVPVIKPDPDPDDCAGHGTHVSGIIGANGGIKGVAPGVTFFAYRVFGCVGSTTSRVLIDAMERAAPRRRRCRRANAPEHTIREECHAGRDAFDAAVRADDARRRACRGPHNRPDPDPA